MENIPTSIFDLIETTTFDELTQEQQEQVLQWMTEEEYRMHQLITNEAETLVYEIPPAAPLHVPAKSVPFWKKPIPIWQAVAGVAAAFLIVFFLPRNIEQIEGESTQIVNVIYDTIFKPADTVIMFTTKRITDTVFVPTSIAQQMPQQRMLEAPISSYGSIKDATVYNTSSVSLKDEKIKINLPEPIRVQF